MPLFPGHGMFILRECSEFSALQAPLSWQRQCPRWSILAVDDVHSRSPAVTLDQTLGLGSEQDRKTHAPTGRRKGGLYKTPGPQKLSLHATLCGGEPQ